MGKKALAALIVAAAIIVAAIMILNRGQGDQPIKKQLDGIVKALPGVENWSFKNADLDALGTLKISQLQLKLAGQPDPLTIGRLEIRGFDGETLARVAALENWREQPETPLAGQFVCDDLIIPVKTRAGLKITKLEGEALKLDAAGAENPEGWAGFLASLAADNLVFSRLESPARPQGAPTGRLVIEAIETRRLADGLIGRYQMTGLEISDPPPSPEDLGDQLKIGQVEISQLTYLAAADFFKKLINGQKPAYDPSLQFLLAPPFGLEELRVTDVIYLAKGKPALTWAEFILSGPIALGQMPALVTVSAKDIVIPIAASPLNAGDGNPFANMGMALSGLGYRDLTVAGFEQQRIYDAGAKTYRESYNYLNVKDAFKLDFFFEFADFEPRKILEASPRSSSNPFTFVIDLPLREFHLKLTDDSLAERVFKFVSIYRGQTIEDAKQSLINDLRANIGPAVKRLTEGDRLLKELSAFIKKPKSVEISLKPSVPTTMTDMGKVDYVSDPEALNQLNLSFSFNGGRPVAMIIVPAAKK